jgi:hypothetical protein
MQKPSAIASRAMRSSVHPSNGASFKGSDSATIRLEIPTGVQGQFLNPQQSYLKFAVTVTGNTNTYVDKSIYQIFSRLVISHNGVVLEQIDEYGTLCNALLDFQVSNSQLSNDLNIMLGTDTAIGGVEGFRMIKSGGTDNVHWFNMPLVSSLFTMQDKYIPIGDIQNELRIELTLAPNGFRTITDITTAYDYTVSAVELMCDIVELDPAVASAVRKETLSRDGAFKIPLVQWRAYSSTIQAQNDTASITIPAKMNSLKNLLVLQREASKVASRFDSKNDRRGGASTEFENYWFQIGSQMVPAKPVSHVYEAYTELQRSMHDLSIGSGDSVLNRTSYSGSKFMQGLELESLSHRSDVLNSGLNTMSLNIYWNPKFKAGGYSTATRVDFFAHYDALLMIDPTGQCNVVF